MIRRAAMVAALATALAGPGARACSVISSYRVPTTLDLVATGETIVVGTIVDGHGQPSDRSSADVVVQPTMLLKGRALPDRVDLPGARLERDPRVIVTRSSPRNIRNANPDTGSGGCVRYLFRPGMQLVLFLTRDKDGKLVPYRAPFSRDAEDVTGPDALWVKALREYAKVARHPPEAWDAQLRRRIVALRAGKPDADRGAIAEDMEAELARRARPGRPPWDRGEGTGTRRP